MALYPVVQALLDNPFSLFHNPFSTQPYNGTVNTGSASVGTTSGNIATTVKYGTGAIAIIAAVYLISKFK